MAKIAKYSNPKPNPKTNFKTNPNPINNTKPKGTFTHCH